MSQESDAILAAGLLFDVDLDAATVDELTARLQGLASSSMLWTRLGAGRPVPPDERRPDPHLPEWRPVTIPSDEADGRLADAWQRLIDAHAGPVEGVRVEVTSPDDALFLSGLDGVTGGPVSPVIGQESVAFEWGWPLRIGVHGPHAKRWVDELDWSFLHGDQAGGDFTATITTPEDPADGVTVLIVDGDIFDPDDQDAWEQALWAASNESVLVVAGSAPAAELLERVHYRSMVVVAVPEPGVGWWGRVLQQLAHDVPLDLALRLCCPGSLIRGIGGVLDRTAIAHWAWEAVKCNPRLDGLYSLIEGNDFQHEDAGFQQILGWVGENARGLKVGEYAGSQSAAIHDFDHGEETTVSPPRSPSKRRLLAEIWDDDRECRTVAPPDRDLALELWIAVPEVGQIATPVEFPPVPTSDEVADIEIEVSSEVWTSTQTQVLRLPTASDQASTSVIFDFHSPAAGSTVRFDIAARFNGRTLQTAVLTVPIRERAMGRDKVRFLSAVTTAGPVPTPDLSPVEYSLDARAGQLRRGSAEIPLSDVRELLDAIEKRASRTLGVDPAPTQLTEQNAKELLIFLARRGSELYERLRPLRIEPQGAIGIHVLADTPVLPVELVYQADPPRQGARLCRHVTDPQANPAPAWGEPCPLAGRSAVCPYAFWGMYRTIIRDVSLPPGQVNPRLTLELAPILYAATQIADFGAPSGVPKPSDLLADEAQRLSSTGLVNRVTSWTAWRKAVRHNPPLLMLLAHRETVGGESGLFIGKQSFLASVDVRTDVVAPRADAAPPLVVLMACASASTGNAFGTLLGAFAARGAGAVVGTLSKLSGLQGAQAGAALLRSLHTSATSAGLAGTKLADAMAAARRELVAQGLLIGLLLVSHGDMDLRIKG